MLLAPAAPAALAPAWPEGSYTSRPWLRWFWPGGVADKVSVSTQLEAIAIDGFGGVCLSLSPGDPGLGARYRPWLGPGAVEMIAHAAREAERLGLGFDLDGAAGHPLGGPSVTGADRASRIQPVILGHEGGPLELDLGEPGPSLLAAWPRQGPPVDLIPWIEEGKLDWDAPPGHWRVFGIIPEPTRREVVDPAPGGEGWMLDPFHPTAMERFLARQDEAFARYDGPFPRAHFLDLSGHESADWSAAVPAAFQNARGYPLAEHLPALFGEGQGADIERVLGDYRETLSDLRLESVRQWQASRPIAGSRTRAAGHDSSAHPLDFPALVDIPTVVIEAPLTPTDRRHLHFASSAAASRANPLVAAELRWPSNRRLSVTPWELKREADRAWLAGANHLVLHSLALPDGGRPSPHPPDLDANHALRASRDALASYISRCQALLQSGAPDHRVLLHLPVHDFWAEGDAPRKGAFARWLKRSGYQAAVEQLEAAGIPFLSVSDRMIRELRVENGELLLGELPFSTLVLPEVNRLSENTALKLLEIGQLGGHLTVVGSWPRDVPGLLLADVRRGTLFQAFRALPEEASSEGNELLPLLQARRIGAGPLAGHGIDFIRRRLLDGTLVFLVNNGTSPFDGWLPLAGHPAGVTLLDPMLPELSGLPPLRDRDGQVEGRLTLAPGQSVFLKLHERAPDMQPARFADPDGGTLLSGEWSLAPAASDEHAITTPILGPWTSAPDPALRDSPGPVHYQLDFTHPDPAGMWILDLGMVASTATVRLNGDLLGKAFAPPFRVLVRDGQLKGDNSLVVEVDDSPAGSATPSGLLGPVRLIPVVSASE